MGVLKVIELLSNSNKSWKDATRKAVKHASKTVKTFGLYMYKIKVQQLMEMMLMNFV